MKYVYLNDNKVYLDDLSVEDIFNNDNLEVFQEEEVRVPAILLIEVPMTVEQLVDRSSRYLNSTELAFNLDTRYKWFNSFYSNVLRGCELYGFDKVEAMHYAQSKLTKLGLF